MRTAVIVLLVLGALCFLGAWVIAVNGDVLGSENFNAYLAAGGFFATLGLVAERVR